MMATSMNCQEDSDSSGHREEVRVEVADENNDRSLAKKKGNEGKGKPVGHTRGQAGVQSEVEKQPDEQNIKSPYHSFQHFHVINTHDSASGRHKFELDCTSRGVVSDVIIQIPEDLNEGSSTHAENETLKILQDIVTSPENVLPISSVTYVFILVENSTDKSFTVTPEPSLKNVLALIYDARNKRFVLVLQGKIEESKEWKCEILKTVFDMILLLYEKNTQAVKDTSIPCNIPNCLQILKALCPAAFKSVHRGSEITENISKGADKYKQNKSPPVQAMEKMSITKGEQQQQQPQQQDKHDQQTLRQTGVQLIPSGSGQRQQPPESVEVDLIQNQAKGSKQQQQALESVEVPLGQNRAKGSKQQQQAPESVEVPLGQNRAKGSKQQQQAPESFEAPLEQNRGSEQQPAESLEVPLRQNRGKPDKDTGISGKFQNSKIISDK